MKSLKKAMVGMMAAALAGTMVCGTALAGEAAPQAAPEQAVAEAATEAAPQATPDTAKKFVTADGVLSIQIPKDDDNWTVIDDPNSWFAISDGKDLIAVDHVAAGDPVPSVELADAHYEEIFQVFYSTQNEVFVVTGRIADKNEAQTVRDAVTSFQVLKYGEVQKKEAAAPQPAYAVRDVNETRYCTERDGVNVRSGYTTDDPIIGGFHYGDQVAVTGVVTRDGADMGWIRVNYNGQTGYTAAQFYSTTKPAPQPAPQPTPEPEEELIADGKIFTGAHMKLYDVNGNAVTLSELNQGGWAYEATGEIFHRGPAGEPYWYGDHGTTLSEEYSDPEEELINGGQIFTGFKMDNLIDVNTGEYVTLSELSQGGWANEDTGEIFTMEGGGGPHMYGNDGTVLMFAEEYYADYEEDDNGEFHYTGNDEGELINDGQIFLDNYLDLYTEDGYYVLVRELSQGGWANEDTGEIFLQEGGGGDHFYGDQGTTLVTEWYYNEYLDD